MALQIATMHMHLKRDTEELLKLRRKVRELKKRLSMGCICCANGLRTMPPLQYKNIYERTSEGHACRYGAHGQTPLSCMPVYPAPASASGLAQGVRAAA